ncbi:multiple monosaccharide ABC transporter permease [Nocardia goodfellowii]|uniref:Xylose transport system permease protein XylH n=1 Tax=Nocardia goodfellowii TaxID=882446 RepID=A0ABS4QNJ6_9NOCA|nr:multiple monosaccharide ABC transporter permease [Nocardia goodfellowii]MBP2193277.1 putative multiple sugar transport system permease protein [Nocardia goodfellowii]
MTLLDKLQDDDGADAIVAAAGNRPGAMETVRKALRGNVRQYGMIVALVAIVVLFQILTTAQLSDGVSLLTPLNVTNVILQNGYILVLAIGMMLVIINGHIDLSVGSVCALVGALTGIAIVHWHWPWPVVVVAGLLLGGLIGAWQGYWIAYVKIPAFIVTLGGMLLFRGLAQLVLEGQSIGPFPKGFVNIAGGYLPNWLPVQALVFDGFENGVVVRLKTGELHGLTLLLAVAAIGALVWTRLRVRQRRRSYGLPAGPRALFVAQMVALGGVIGAFGFVLASYNGLPVIGLILVVLIVVYSFVMNRMVIGRRIYAVGGNEKAAALSGVDTRRNTFWVFVNMGALAALAGIIFAARLGAATPKAGQNFELDAIAAAFVGGASASGGIGTVVGAIVGALVMGVMNNGMSMLGVGSDWQLVIKGLVLLAAVAFDVYNKKRAAA